MELEQFAEYLENPGLLDGFSDSENLKLKLSGLFYWLEYHLADADSIPFAGFYLSENPQSRYKDYFVDFLIHKNSTGSPQANRILFDFLLTHPDPDLLIKLVENQVKPLSSKQNILFVLYQNDRRGFLQVENHLEILSAFFLKAPAGLRQFLIEKAETNQLINWVILAKAVMKATSKDYYTLLVNFENFSPAEKKLTTDFLAYFIKNQPALTELAFQLYNTYQSEEILSLIQTHHLQTQNLEDFSVFLLLTNQWEEYDSFDFDQTYLKNAFLQASPALRQKILSQSRKSGQFSWLHDISKGKQTKWVSDLNEADWKNILTHLIREGDDVNLLRILKISPPIQAKTIINAIQFSGENQLNFTRDEYWENLVNLVRHLPGDLPTPKLIKQTGTLANPVLSSEIHSNSKEIFLGTPSNLIQKVGLDSLKPVLPALSTSAPQIRHMLLTKDQRYLILAHGDHQIRVLRLDDNQVVKIFSGHVGYIKKLLLSENQKTLYSTGFDGKLIAWRFPLGPMIHSSMLSSQECFDMDLTAGQKSGVVATAEGSIHVFDTTTLKPVRKLQVSECTVTSLTASLKTPQIAVYDTSETLSIWNIESSYQIASAKITSSPITALAYSDHDDFVIAGHLSGALSFYSTTSALPLVSAPVYSQPVINFHKLDHHRLLIIFRDGHLCLVDFSILNALYTPINLLTAEIVFSDSINIWGDFVNSLYRFIHRFDIQIREEQSIQIGEYDIQIE